MCVMAALKQHGGFGFWLSRKVVGEMAEDGMGQFGKLASLKDLPTKRELTAYIRKAMAWNEAGVKPARPKAAAKPAPALPDDLAALRAQKKQAAARETYAGFSFSPSAQREYFHWIGEAKTAATRQKRIVTTLEWVTEGKPCDWKYLQC